MAHKEQESLANAKGSARQCPMLNRNTIPALGRKLHNFHTPLLFGTSAP